MAPFGTLYTTPKNARALKILATANINGLEITISPDFVYGETTKEPGFLAKFPMGKVPALETADGFSLSEASAIAFFAAASGPKSHQLLGSDPKERALVQQWVFFAETEILPNLISIITPMLGHIPYSERAVGVKTANLGRALRVAEQHLQQGRKWLVNESCLSLADLSLASALYWGFQYFIDDEMRMAYPEITAWYLRLLGEEGVREAFGAPEMVHVRGPPCPA